MSASYRPVAVRMQPQLVLGPRGRIPKRLRTKTLTLASLGLTKSPGGRCSSSGAAPAEFAKACSAAGRNF